MRALNPSTARIATKASWCLAFPANDFAGQEPGTEAEINEFCRSTYGMAFPMFAKIAVTGPDEHPLYETLIAARPEGVNGGENPATRRSNSRPRFARA